MIYLIIYCVIVIASSLMSKPLTQQLKQIIDDDDEVDIEYAMFLFCVIPIVNIITFICSIIVYVCQIFRKN